MAPLQTDERSYHRYAARSITSVKRRCYVSYYERLPDQEYACDLRRQLPTENTIYPRHQSNSQTHSRMHVQSHTCPMMMIFKPIACSLGVSLCENNTVYQRRPSHLANPMLPRRLSLRRLFFDSVICAALGRVSRGTAFLCATWFRAQEDDLQFGVQFLQHVERPQTERPNQF
jgi:hypothetical protein